MKQLLLLADLSSYSVLAVKLKQWLMANRADIFIYAVFALLFATVILFSKSENLFRSLFPAAA